MGQIVNRSGPFDEILIIDDASTDNSIDIIRQITENVAFCVVQRNEKNVSNENVTRRSLSEINVYLLGFISTFLQQRNCSRVQKKIERE